MNPPITSSWDWILLINCCIGSGCRYLDSERWESACLIRPWNKVFAVPSTFSSERCFVFSILLCRLKPLDYHRTRVRNGSYRKNSPNSLCSQEYFERNATGTTCISVNNRGKWQQRIMSMILVQVVLEKAPLNSLLLLSLYREIKCQKQLRQCHWNYSQSI